MSASWLARRAVWSVGVLVAVGLVAFLLTHVLPIDPARAWAGSKASAADVERARIYLGLDHSLAAQLFGYLQRLVQGDMGYSNYLHRPVSSAIAERLPATLELAIGGAAVELAIGIPLGVLAASGRRRLARLADVAAVASLATPSIVVGALLLDWLAFGLQQSLGVSVLPIGGTYRPLDLRYLLLPALALGLPGAGMCARLTRVALAEEMRRDYVRTARAKGALERRVVWIHAMRNALGAVVSQLGLDLGSFVGGVVVVEAVFSWPGIGQLAFSAVENTDVPVVVGAVLLAALGVLLANLAVDVVQVRIDPRLAGATAE